MKKETFKRRIRKITAFAAAVAMAVTVTMPGEIFGNIDFGITVFAEENGYDNGFCTTYTEENGCTNPNHTDCNGYQPATDSDSDGFYEIGNAGQLYWFAALVNGTDGLTQDLGANAILTDNIKINSNVLVGDELNSANASSFRKWTPIGKDYDNQYKGTFDGKNKTISGLYYNEDINSTSRSYVGLFGHINGGSISNVEVNDTYFYLFKIAGYSYISGICAINENGTVSNCYNRGTISAAERSKACRVGGVCAHNLGGIVKNCYNYGSIFVTLHDLISEDNSGASYTSGYIGGVVGSNYQDKNGNTKIENCHNTADIMVTELPNGSNGSIENIRYDLVGGICGASNAYITGCHNSGNVEGQNYGRYNTGVGGVCGGQIEYSYISSSYGTITNCYNTGTVKGTSNVGGICGWNWYAGTVENCYSAGSVSGSSSVGGVCGYNETSVSISKDQINNGVRNTITNCYYDKSQYGGEAVGWNGNIGSVYEGILEKVEGKTLADFSEGEVCYLLNNGEINGSQVWYQTLDSEAYPNLDTTNKESRTVYACTPCTGVFSNTSGQTAQHTFAVDTENGKQHKCEKCGETHNAEFTEDDTTDTISVCCDLGSVTLKAPTENLTYDGTAKAATVEGALTGIENPKILYNLKGSTEEAVETAPVNAGTYVASITYTDADSVDHTVRVEYTIEKADPVVTADTEQNVVCGVGTFTEPVSKGVDGNTLAGAFTYDSKSYDDAVAILKTETNGSTGSIDYTFTPTDTTNYNTASGTINYTMIDVAFMVGDEAATADNAVTVKANPTYGDTWADILTLKDGLKAVLLDETVTTGFSFDVTGSPDAGNAQEYNVLFNGTIGGKTFTNHVVATGTVDVAKKEIGNIAITDITAPAPKATLDTSADTSTTGCTPVAVSWTDGDTSVTEAGFDKAYTAKVTVTADSNHTFGSSLTATVNDETASVTNNGDGTATVTYTFEKTAAAAVTGISINTLPTKTEYFVGENIDLTGAKITATYEDSTSKNIDITSEMISDFDSSAAGTNTVTVTYEGKTTTFNVTIKEPAVTGITISTKPKTEYLIDDTLDVSGGKITVSYEYGADKVISITSAMVTGFNSSAAVESQTLTVTYQEKTDTYVITVKKHTPTVTAPTASAITLGQTLADSTLSDTTWSWSDSTIEPTSAGTKSYTAVKNVDDANYYDYSALSGFTFNSSTNTLTAEVSVEVKRAAASVTPPTASNTLTYGQTLADAGLTEGWTWENASTVPDVNNTGYTAYKIVTDYDNYDYSNLTGFDYDETAHKLSCNVSVTVTPTAPTNATTASQSFTKGTASTAFAAPVFKGIDSAVLTGSVSYTYGGQTYATTAALTAALDLLDGGESGTISYTFTPTSTNYTTASGSITFSVIDAVVTGITLKSAPTKTTYEIGDTLDLTGGKITVSYNNGTSIDIDITAEMISGFDSTTAGEKTVTVTYSGFTATFKVTVSKGSFTVEPTPGNMEGAKIDMTEEELYNAVLTPEDKALIEQGVDIAVLMTVITINPETVPANDVTAIENVMDDFDLGCYIDVSLFKKYSNSNTEVPVTDTNSPITISFKVPADILAQYPVSDYEYSVFCSHNGVGYPITCSYNAATNVMSFSSTMFSTYALAVKSRTPAAVDYTITADSHVTVQATAQAGDIVSVTVEDGYKAIVTNSLGAVITTITGTGSFVMPESNVTITSELINTHVHNYSTEWKSDSTSHWHECSCGDRANIALHVSNGGIVTVRPTETTEGVRTYSCSICGYVMRTETIPTLDPDHSHSYGAEWKSDSTSHWHECDCGEKVDIASHISDNGVVTLQPTETSEGIMTYSCSICGYILRTETIPANTPVHTHNYGTAWYYDSTCHWHECSCGDRSNIGQHISNGGIVTVQPTATSTGLRVYSCSVCGYVLRTETIPATGYNYPNYPTYPTYPTYPFDSSIFNVVTFTDKVNVTAETEGNTITIKWDKVEKADKYYVYQYKNGKYVKVKTTSDTSATFKKLKNGETYKFLIRYTKSGRLSPTKYSGTISVKVYYKPIPKPTATKNSIKLTWEAVPEAEKYAIYKYVDGKAVKLTETKKLSVKIGKLIPDTEYKYIVRAYVDGKWTTMLKSDIVTVKTKAE